MKGPFDDLDNKSIHAAKNIRIAFDDNAWDKMEALLNEDDDQPVAHVNSTTALVSKVPAKNYRLLLFLLTFLLSGTAVVIITNNNAPKNKFTPFVNSDSKISAKEVTVINRENLINNRVKAKQFVNTYHWQQQGESNSITNKNLTPGATISKKTSLAIIPAINYENNEMLKGYSEMQENRRNDPPLFEQREQQIKVAIKNMQPELTWPDSKIAGDTINTGTVLHPDKKSLENSAVKNKIKRHSSSLKNKFFKNIGFSVFVSPEINSVQFKGGGKVTANYGAGVNYSIGKHFTLQAQFVKSRKVYATDRKGYNPPPGSSLVSVDTFKVNADCNVWEIPVNLQYSFKGNNKNSFFIAAGISSFIMKKEVYDFAYYEQGIYETKQRVFINENKHSFCSLNLSAGYQYWLNKNWSVGFEPYLKLPLNGIGAGKVKLTSAGALFNLTFKPF